MGKLNHPGSMACVHNLDGGGDEPAGGKRKVSFKLSRKTTYRVYSGDKFNKRTDNGRGEESVFDLMQEIFGRNIPGAYLQWVGIGLISTVLGRGCYTVIRESFGPIYPNFFITLVGEPGRGKSVPIGFARDILERIRYDIGPDKLSPESMIKHLAERFKDIGESSGSFWIDELQYFLQRKRELDIRPGLTSMFNCPNKHKESTIKHGVVSLYKVFLTLCTATTPDHIYETITPRDMRQGFAARFFWVWAKGEEGVEARGFFKETQKRSRDLEERLVGRLKELEKIKGRFKWTEAAKKMFGDLAEKGFPPYPKDPLFKHYVTRRPLFLAKLCLINSADRGGGKVISTEDLQKSLDILHGYEATAAEGLRNLGSSPQYEAQRQVLEWLRGQPKGEVNKHDFFVCCLKYVGYHGLEKFVGSLLEAGEVEIMFDDYNGEYYKITRIGE